MRGLAGGLAQPSAAAGGTPAGQLRQQLASMAQAGRDEVLLDLIRVHVAAVLECASPGDVNPDHAFTDLGFDSLTAVELRNRLHAATGLLLPSPAAFDYRTPVRLAQKLSAELSAAGLLSTDGPRHSDDALHDGRRYVASADSPPADDVLPANFLRKLYQQVGRMAKRQRSCS